MKNQVKNNVSATDIQETQATLIIPLAITIICSTLDMLFRIKLGMIKIELLSDGIVWVLGTLISYYFPSFLALSCSLLWEYYFTDGWTGIKAGKGRLLFSSTVIYFVFYIIYLLCADTVFIYVFVVINIIYVWVVLKKCMDEKVLKGVSVAPNDKIRNDSC